MTAVTSAQMRRIDRTTIQRCGIPVLLLMDNAGHSVAETARDLLKKRGGRRVTVLSGGGNNGGDGIAAARYLCGWGFLVQVLWLKNPGEWQGDLAAHYRMAKRCGVRFQSFARIPASRRIRELKKADVLIDALLGTGTHGPLRVPFFDAIVAMNTARRPTVAVDIPSGLDPDTGRIAETAVKANVTVTLAAAKTGLLKVSARPYVGKLIISDIGIPVRLLR